MQIEAFFTIYKTAAWDKNITAMIDLYDEQAILFDTWDKGYITDRSEWANIIKDWLGSLGDEKVNVEFEMIKIHQSGNAGFASALIQYQAISNQGIVLRTMKNRITIGFLKKEGRWKVVHQHISAPISSNRLTAILGI